MSLKYSLGDAISFEISQKRTETQTEKELNNEHFSSKVTELTFLRMVAFDSTNPNEVLSPLPYAHNTAEVNEQRNHVKSI